MTPTADRPRTADSPFYVTGGTMPRDAPSYVPRRADDELLAALSRGEFCYVLTARQMGKSSLMIRTKARLEAQGDTVVVLDLTAVGQNLAAEQWYDGLLNLVGRQLRLEDALDDFWLSHERLGPLQRWMAAIREVVLPNLSVQAFRRSGVQEGPTSEPERPNARTPECLSRLVIFIDEIDVVQSLPFSADEFFAGIRECYTRRANDPEFERLTFCLLGVASPTDLIQDTRITPFNIGRRIELTDFTEAEAAPLALGLGEEGERGRRGEGESQVLLGRILYWTGGHPYLTQRLCQAVAEADVSNPKSQIQNPKSIDRHCERLFLSSSAQERDDNLLFVRERVLKSGADPAGLLDLYARVRSHKPVPVDDTNSLVSVLRLSGITRVVEGRLRPRNRIYERVFDWAWAREHMPDAELRRQRAAYRKGLWRAAVVSGLILAVVGVLALSALRSESRARRSEANAQRSAGEARGARDRATGLLYASQMNLAHQAYKAGKLGRALVLLKAQRGGPDGRSTPLASAPWRGSSPGFEWRYLWRLCRSRERYVFRGREGVGMHSVAYSPNGRLLATGDAGGAVQLWDAATTRPRSTLPAHEGAVDAVAFSPDGRVLATASGDEGAFKLWDVASERLLFKAPGGKGMLARFAYSPDGKALAVGDSDGKSSQLWDVRWRPGRPRPDVSLKRTIPGSGPMAFSPDSRTVAFAADAPLPRLRLHHVTTGREVVVYPASFMSIHCLAFSPDGKKLVTGHSDGTMLVLNATTGLLLRRLRAGASMLWSIAFSLDGKTLAAGSNDGTLKLWDVPSGREQGSLHGHTGPALSLAFAPDGETLVSASPDGTARLWGIDLFRPRNVLRGLEASARLPRHPGQWVSALAFSPDGRTLAVARWGRLSLENLETKREVAYRKGEPGDFYSLAYAPGGKTLAVGSINGRVRLWDTSGLRPLGAPILAHTLEIRHVAFGLHGRVLVTGSADGSIKLWDVASRRRLHTIPGVAGPQGRPFAISPDGEILAAGYEDHTVRLWDLRSRRQVSILEGKARYLNAIEFSPDGQTLAGGDINGPVILWDTKSGRQIRTLLGHQAAVMEMAFSPDGRTLATGSMDHTVKLWNPGIDQEVATLEGHTHWVLSVAFSPDGNTLASAGGLDRDVRLWRAAPLAETQMAADPLAR